MSSDENGAEAGPTAGFIGAIPTAGCVGAYPRRLYLSPPNTYSSPILSFYHRWSRQPPCHMDTGMGRPWGRPAALTPKWWPPRGVLVSISPTQLALASFHCLSGVPGVPFGHRYPTQVTLKMPYSASTSSSTAILRFQCIFFVP